MDWIELQEIDNIMNDTSIVMTFQIFLFDILQTTQ